MLYVVECSSVYGISDLYRRCSLMKISNKQLPVILAILFINILSISAVADYHRVSIPSVPKDTAASHPDNFDQLIGAAYILYTQKKYEEALAKCAEAAKLRPADNRPYAITGVVYMAQWKMKSASEALAKAISFSPGNKQLHLLKAKADRFRNAKDESIAAARKAIELDPLFAEAYAILGEALAIGDKDRDAAIEAYRIAVKLKPELFEVYKQLGMLLSVSEDQKGAEDVYRKAMELDPKKMASRFDLGRLLVEQGRLAEARSLWEGRTSDTDNTFPNFITLLERAEKLKQATEALEKKPNDSEALVQMGMMVMEGDSWVVDGRQERAIEYFRKALAIEPDFAKAQYAICMAYVQLADTYKDKNKNVDEELAKLRKFDTKLADEIAEYRKSYSGGLKAVGEPVNQ